MSQLQIKSTEEEGIYILSGTIAADAEFSPLLQESCSHFIFRFGEVEKITSIGVKKWVEGIRLLRQNGRSIEFQGCPEILIEQCNLIPEMTHDVTIHSFEVCFVCESCDEEELRVLKVEELDLDDLPPAVPCPSCQIDMIPENEATFKFITKH